MPDINRAVIEQLLETLRSQALSDDDFARAESVLVMAAELCGDVQQTLQWYRSERLAIFGNKTAEILVREKRTADLIRYLGSFENGSLG